jgi:cytochrome c-type biogenesis protein CcmH
MRARGVQTRQRAIRVAAFVACAAAASAAWPDAALDARLKSLESQLRCLVCQNQTLAESEAPLAADLRNEVRELAVAGRSDADIRAYLVARYGDFVLYKPPVKPTTYLLWFGPFVLLAGGALAWWSVVRRRASRANARDADDGAAPSAADAPARARSLLEG